MKYSQIINTARSAGTATERHMQQSIARIDSLLESIKTIHPDIYWQFLRDTHEDLNGPHYNQSYADYDLSRLLYTGKDGIIHTTPHWTPEDIERATANKTFPEGTTLWDKYVAYNTMYADLCRKFSDSEILEAAYLYFFIDDDAPEGKIWRYMQAMRPK